MRKDIISSALGDPRPDAAVRGPVPARRSPASARSPSPATPTARRSTCNGKLVGSKIIGQAVHRPGDQQERQAAARQERQPGHHARPALLPDPPVGDGARRTTPPAPTFSNLGPNNIATEQAIAANIQAYLALEKPYDPGLTTSQVPVDAANTSASGIDPDISVANADIQAHRVAAVRHLPLSQVMSLVSQVHPRARPRVLRRARRQRARAQPRPRPSARSDTDVR